MACPHRFVFHLIFDLSLFDFENFSSGDNQGFGCYADFPAAGDYEIEFTGRSTFHLVAKLALFRSNVRENQLSDYKQRACNGATPAPTTPPVTTVQTAPPTTPVPPTTPGTPVVYELRFSTNANRTPSNSLANAVINNGVAIFLSPETNVQSVTFRLPPATTRTEGVAPFDFAGGSVDLATLFDSTTLANGAHTISTTITSSVGGQQQTITSTFTVNNAAGTTSTGAPSTTTMLPVTTGTIIPPGGTTTPPGGTTSSLGGTTTLSGTTTPGGTTGTPTTTTGANPSVTTTPAQQPCVLPPVTERPLVECPRTCCTSQPGRRQLHFLMSDEFSQFDCPMWLENRNVVALRLSVCGFRSGSSIVEAELDANDALAAMSDPSSLGIPRLMSVTDPLSGESNSVTNSGVSIALIIGIVTGIIVLAIVVLVIILLCRRHKQHRYSTSFGSSSLGFVPLEEVAPPKTTSNFINCLVTQTVSTNGEAVLMAKEGQIAAVLPADFAGTSDWVWVSISGRQGYVPRTFLRRTQ